MTTQIVSENAEATDAMFDIRPEAMAVRFGQRARQLMADGRDPYEAARLAGSYAFMTDRFLRGEPATLRIGDTLRRLARELNREHGDRLFKVQS